MLVSIPVYTLPPLPAVPSPVSPTFLTYTNGLNGWHHDVEGVLQRNWKAIEAGFNRFTSLGVVFGSSAGFLTQSSNLMYETTKGLTVGNHLQVVGNTTLTGTFRANSTAIGVFGSAPTTLAPAYTTAAFTTLRVFGSTVSTGGGATTLSSHFNRLLGVVACMAKDLGVGGAGYGWLR